MYNLFKKWSVTILLSLSALAAPVFAQDGEEVMSEEEWQRAYILIEKRVSGFKYQTGKVQIGEELATVDVPNGYKFLGKGDSRYILEDVYGNPPDDTVLGTLFIAKQSPLDEDLSYFIVLSYSEDGYIEDDDAKEIDYNDLLEELQDDAEEANKIRVKEGYPTAKLIGWAQKPYYDDKNKKLHWAKEFTFDNSPVNTLNYDVRILGRKGYLSMNIIGSIDVLPMVKSDIGKFLDSTNFNEGNQYGDYEEGIDSVAAYGIGGLVAGKVLGKIGFFAILAKFGKFIIAGLIALGAVVKKIFFGSKEEKTKSIENSEQE